MTQEKIMRGISEQFAETFKQSCLYNFYFEHKDELILGVRNGYINLYYNCDSIAKIRCGHGKVSCVIASYYLKNEIIASPKEKDDKKVTYIPISAEEIVSKYEQQIKPQSDADTRSTDEKKAQARLVLCNNNNPASHWYCVDVEYRKQFLNKKEREDSGFNGRFDIVAVSKSSPHRVAIIELKYGAGAMGGSSGIKKHVEDFYQFKHYYESFKDEIISMLNSQSLLGVSVPVELRNLDKTNFEAIPEFYFITLDNNAKSPRGYTPKQTMGAYLFNKGTENYNLWECKREAGGCIDNEFGDITRKDNKKIHATFLFSGAKYPELGITDIIDGEYDEIIRPK